MRDFTILFGRPQVPQDGEDRFELEALAAEEVGIDSYAIPSIRSSTASRSARCAVSRGPVTAGGSTGDGC